MLTFRISRWRWGARTTVVYAAVCGGICSYLILTPPVSAAPQKASAKSVQRLGWKKSTRMGVTAVVLPRCAVQLGAQVASQRQPLTVRCTQNADYSFSSSSPLVDILAAGRSGETSGAGVPGQTTRYVITRNTEDKGPNIGSAEAPLLSIDF